MDGRRRELRGDEGAVEALAGERVEEPRGIAREQPAGSGTAGHSMPDRPRPLDAVQGGLGAPRGRVVRRGRDRGDEPRGHGLGTVASHRRAPRRTEDDPDVDAPTRDRRDADVPIADEAHPGVAIRGTVRIGEVVGHAEARREPGRPRHAAGSGHDRSEAVGADDDARRQGEPLVRPAAVDPRRGTVDVRDGPAPADVRAGGAGEGQGRNPAGPVEADGRGRPLSAPYVRRNDVPAGVSTRIAGIGRASSQGSDRRVRAVGAPRPPPARRRPRPHASATPGPARGARRRARAPRGASPGLPRPARRRRWRPPRQARSRPPAPSWSTSVGTTAAIAYR